MYTAKLIQGSDYSVLGHVFKRDKEQKVKKEVYDYLKENPAFEVTESKKKATKEKE